VINDNGDIHPDMQENIENQSMQEQLEHDPDYIAWAKTQEMTEAERDQMAKDLEGEVF